MDIFARISSKGKLPKDKEFKTLGEESDVSMRNLFPLAYPPQDPFPELSGMGRLRLPVGFMQTVMELITVKGDIFWDLSAGCGSSFTAADLCGRYVIGFEDREVFYPTCLRSFQKTFAPISLLLNPLGSLSAAKKKKARETNNPWAALDSSSAEEDPEEEAAEESEDSL